MNMPRERPCVLLVEDYEDARQMYAQYLIFSGFDVVEAVDGGEAIQLAIERHPDVILMDLALPKIDGWEATRQLKADPRTSSIPVVALSGHALAGYEQSARAAGCDAFVAKPCLPGDLVTELRRILSVTATEDVERSTARRRPASNARGRTARGGTEPGEGP